MNFVYSIIVNYHFPLDRLDMYILYLKLAEGRRGDNARLLPWGAERLGARAPTKFSEEILQWAGTHKVLAEKVRGNGNFR